MADQEFRESRLPKMRTHTERSPTPSCGKSAATAPGGPLAAADDRGSKRRLPRGQGHVTMWDDALSSLEKCRRLAASRGVQVTTERVDVTKAKWPEAQYDTVVNTYLHLPGPQRLAVLSHMASAVKLGGHLVMEVFSLQPIRYGTVGPADPAFLYIRPHLGFPLRRGIKHWFWGEMEWKEGL